MTAQETPSSVAADPAAVTLPTVDALLDESVAAVDEAPPRYRLPLAAIPSNVLLQSALMRLVEQKERLDRLVREGALVGLLPPEWSGAHGPDLKAFVLSVVPFVPDVLKADTASARVPLKFLLGQSQRWSAADVPEPKSLAAYLASDERGSAGNKDPAEVMLLAPLGVCWAQEGRSRVGFLRAMGMESMAARVTALAYPAPTQLALYHAASAGVAQIWCVLDGRKVRPLVAPWLSVPLLTAYGVAAPQTWPANWPATEAVAGALALARGGLGAVEVDLARVAEGVRREQAGEAWAGASLMQLHTWVPRWRFFLASFIGLPAALLLIAALALPGRVEAAAVAAALGFAGGAIAALAAPWIYARRKHLS
ncbi:MAG: hypothetical protein ACOH1V_06150 [Stenotrophomonas sp.]